MNIVLLKGFLGSDPETRYINDHLKATFSMATNSTFTNRKGEKQQRTTWHRIAAWDFQAEIAKAYLTKGSLCFITGSLENREWDDPEGNKHRITEVRAAEITPGIKIQLDTADKSSPPQERSANNAPGDDVPPF